MKIRQKFVYADTRAELVEYKDAKRGASEDEMWDNHDELIDHRPFKKKRSKKKYPGCEGNDGGPHVYIWVSYPVVYPYVTWSSYAWWKNYEIRVCCGCEKRAKVKSFRRKP